MKELDGRVPGVDPSDTAEEVTPTEEESMLASEGVGRRAVLLGAAAASAGVVAATAHPAMAAPAAVATHSSMVTPLAITQTSGTTAAQVSVAPAGEFPPPPPGELFTNAQVVLEDLDQRLGKTHLIDDLRVAMTLIDDFLGGTDPNFIGQLGWKSAGNGTTSGAVAAGLGGPPGMWKIGTGGADWAWKNVTLGGGNYLSAPTYVMCEWRIRANVVGTTPCWFGLHDAPPAGPPPNVTTPTKGLFFQYPGDSNDGKWWAVGKGASNRAKTTNVSVESGSFHRFRIIYTNGVAYFFIDGNPAPPPDAEGNPTNGIPVTLGVFSVFAPAASIQKTGGTSGGVLNLDYFALRWETPR
jgi:hypothetical protein